MHGRYRLNRDGVQVPEGRSLQMQVDANARDGRHRHEDEAGGGGRRRAMHARSGAQRPPNDAVRVGEGPAVR